METSETTLNPPLTLWHIPCKHFWAVLWFYPAWNWARVPESYQGYAYLSTYTGALDTFNDSPPGIIDDLQDGAPIVRPR